ncbi:AI-2E family transporter (plasmid) [Clostridium perfringens]
MFKKFYENGGKYILFFLLFNLIFLLVSFGIKYAFPFLISVLLTIWLYPISKWIHKNTKINKNIINVFVVLTSLTIIGVVLVLVSIGVFNETANTLAQFKDFQLDTEWLSGQIESIKVLLNKISPDVLNSFTSQLEGLIATAISYLGLIANWLVKIATAIPAGIVVILMIILSTFFLLRDYDLLSEKFDSIKIGDSDVVKNLLKRAYDIVVNYIQSYGILLSITFIECVIIFTLFGINNVFTLSLICVALDILPIVGTAIIFIPMVLVLMLQNNFIGGLVLLILYIFMEVVRSIMEPKLLSKSLDIHPVAILMSIYIGLKLSGIIGIIYCIFLIAYFKILHEEKIL